MEESYVQDASSNRNPGLFNGNQLKLGIFAANCSGGLAFVNSPDRWVASWDNNLAVAQQADQAGMECMVPLQRWKGYAGDSDVNQSSFDSIAWACGLLSATSRISVFATVHCTLIHPIFAAKQMATADHIGHGRFGLNLVPGSNGSEFRMFGLEPEDHAVRYAIAQEWWDVVKRIWTEEEDFNFSGDHFRLEAVSGRPRPFGNQLPPMMNAGASSTGLEFAIQNSDLHYDLCISPEESKPKIEASKTKAGRNLQVWTPISVVCRATQGEVDEFLRQCVQSADWAALAKREQSILAPKGSKSQSAETVVNIRTRDKARAVIGRMHYGLFGTPDHVANELTRLSEAGFNGVAIGFINYLKEMPFFIQEVIPRLESRGLRRPVSSITQH